MMENWLYAETATFHVKGIFGVYLDNWFLQNWETGFENWDIVCFVKQSEGYLVHTETFFFNSFWVSQLPQPIRIIAIIRIWTEELCVIDCLSRFV